MVEWGDMASLLQFMRMIFQVHATSTSLNDAWVLQVGSIVNTCERYALDAKRLHVQPESDETAAAFESLSSKASQLLTYY